MIYEYTDVDGDRLSIATTMLGEESQVLVGVGEETARVPVKAMVQALADAGFDVSVEDKWAGRFYTTNATLWYDEILTEPDDAGESVCVRHSFVGGKVASICSIHLYPVDVSQRLRERPW